MILFIPAGSAPNDPSPIFDTHAAPDDPEDVAGKHPRLSWAEVAANNGVPFDRIVVNVDERYGFFEESDLP